MEEPTASAGEAHRISESPTINFIYHLPSSQKLITWNNSLALQRDNSGPLSGASATDADFAQRFRDGSITGCLNEEISTIQEILRERGGAYGYKDVDTGYLSYEGSETKCFGSGRTYHPDHCYPKWTAFTARICHSCDMYQPHDTFWTYAGTFDKDDDFTSRRPCELAPVVQETWNPEKKIMELLTCNGKGFDERGIHLGPCQNLVRTPKEAPKWWDHTATYDVDLIRLQNNPETKRFVYKSNSFDVCISCRHYGKNCVDGRFEEGIAKVKAMFAKAQRKHSRRIGRILREIARVDFIYDSVHCCDDESCQYTRRETAVSESAPVAFVECGPECMFDEEYNPEHFDCPLVRQETVDVYDAEYAAMRFTESYNNHTAKHENSVASRFLAVAIPLLLRFRAPRPTKAILDFDYTIPDYLFDVAYTSTEYSYTFEGEICETRTIEREVSPAHKESVQRPWTPPERVTKFLEYFTFGKASNLAAGHKGAHGTFKCQGCNSYVGQGVTCFYEGDTFCRKCAGDFATEFLELNLDMPTFEELKEHKAKCHTLVTTETYTPAKTESVLQYRYRIVTVTNTIPDLVQSHDYDLYNGLLPTSLFLPTIRPHCVEIPYEEVERASVAVKAFSSSVDPDTASPDVVPDHLVFESPAFALPFCHRQGSVHSPYAYSDEMVHTKGIREVDGKYPQAHLSLVDPSSLPKDTDFEQTLKGLVRNIVAWCSSHSSDKILVSAGVTPPSSCPVPLVFFCSASHPQAPNPMILPVYVKSRRGLTRELSSWRLLMFSEQAKGVDPAGKIYICVNGDSHWFKRAIEHLDAVRPMPGFLTSYGLHGRFYPGSLKFLAGSTDGQLPWFSQLMLARSHVYGNESWIWDSPLAVSQLVFDDSLEFNAESQMVEPHWAFSVLDNQWMEWTVEHGRVMTSRVLKCPTTRPLSCNPLPTTQLPGTGKRIVMKIPSWERYRTSNRDIDLVRDFTTSCPANRSADGRAAYNGDFVPLECRTNDLEPWLEYERRYLDTEIKSRTEQYPSGTQFEVLTWDRPVTQGCVKLLLGLPGEPWDGIGIKVILPASYISKVALAKARFLPLVHGHSDHKFWISNGRVDHLYEGFPMWHELSATTPLWSVSDNGHPQMESLYGLGSSIPTDLYYGFYAKAREQYGGDEALIFSIGCRVVLTEPIVRRPNYHNIGWKFNMAGSIIFVFNYPTGPITEEEVRNLTPEIFRDWRGGKATFKSTPPFFRVTPTARKPMTVNRGSHVTTGRTYTTDPRSGLRWIDRHGISNYPEGRSPESHLIYFHNELISICPPSHAVSELKKDLASQITKETAHLPHDSLVVIRTRNVGTRHVAKILGLRTVHEPSFTSSEIVIPSAFSGKVAISILRLAVLAWGPPHVRFLITNSDPGNYPDGYVYPLEVMKPRLMSVSHWGGACMETVIGYGGSLDSNLFEGALTTHANVYGTCEAILWQAGTVVVTLEKCSGVKGTQSDVSTHLNTPVNIFELCNGQLFHVTRLTHANISARQIKFDATNSFEEGLIAQGAKRIRSCEIPCLTKNTMRNFNDPVLDRATSPFPEIAETCSIVPDTRQMDFRDHGRFRCPHQFNTVHHITPQVFSIARSIHANIPAYMQSAIDQVKDILSKLDPNARVHVVAMGGPGAETRHCQFRLQPELKATLTLCFTDRHTFVPSEWTAVRVTPPSGRHLAGLRLLPMFFDFRPVRFAVTNGFTNEGHHDFGTHWDLAGCPTSVIRFNRRPTNCNHFYGTCSSNAHQWRLFVNSMAVAGHVYGTEEALLEYVDRHRAVYVDSPGSRLAYSNDQKTYGDFKIDVQAKAKDGTLSPRRRFMATSQDFDSWFNEYCTARKTDTPAQKVHPMVTPPGFRGLGLPRCTYAKHTHIRGFKVQIPDDRLYAGHRGSTFIYRTGSLPKRDYKGLVQHFNGLIDDMTAWVSGNTSEGDIINVSTWAQADVSTGHTIILSPIGEKHANSGLTVTLRAELSDKLALAKTRLLGLFIAVPGRTVRISNGRKEWHQESYMEDACDRLLRDPAVSITSAAKWGTPACELLKCKSGTLEKYKATFINTMAKLLYEYGADERLLMLLPIWIPKEAVTKGWRLDKEIACNSSPRLLQPCETYLEKPCGAITRPRYIHNYHVAGSALTPSTSVKDWFIEDVVTPSPTIPGPLHDVRSEKSFHPAFNEDELKIYDAVMEGLTPPVRSRFINLLSNLVKASDVSRTKPGILRNTMGEDWHQSEPLLAESAPVALKLPEEVEHRHPAHIRYNHEPTLSNFNELVSVANASLVTFPPMGHIGMGWVYNQGLAYFEPDYAYKNNEWSIFRRKDVQTLHFLDIPTPPKTPLPPFIEELVIWIERNASKFDGKVAITANPDGPPPPASLGFAPLAINGTRDDWITRQVPELIGRENAFARLAVMLTSNRVKDWWILNGREVELNVLPDLIPGRIHTWNRFDACPIVLSSARSDLKIRDERNFAGYLALSRHYGVDEVVLQSYPCTVSMSTAPTVASFGIYPVQGGWEDIEIIHNTKSWYKGEGTRLAIYNAKFANSKMQMPRPIAGPNKLMYDQRKNLGHIERTLAEVPVVDSPLDVEDPSETLLIVAYGTNGDITPVKYMARVAQTIGVKTVLWVLKISKEELRAVVKGDIRSQIRNFILYYGVGRMGFKGVITPQLRVPGNSRTFELTPWEFTDPIRNDYWWSQTLLNLFISVKTPDIKIGSVIGSNFPRSADGRFALKMTSQNPARPEKIGYVLGSDGADTVPLWIQKAYQRIDDPDHGGKAFDGFTKVWCTGGQGIMQTLRMKDVIPLIYAPGFDRTLHLPHSQDYLQETDFSHFVQVLEDMGFRLADNVSKSWRTSIKHCVPRLRQASIMVVVRIVVLLVLNRQWFISLLTTAVSFPELALIARTGLVDAGLLVLAFFVRYPLATSVPGFIFTCCYLAFGEILVLYSKWKLAGTKHVFLGVQTSRKFPFVEHMAIVDRRLGERVHLQWQGDRRNLVNPFRGVVDNHVQPVDNVFFIPVPINYPRAKAALLHRTGRYSPWFNCQTVLPAVTDYNFFVTAIVLTAQVFIFPLTFIAYVSWIGRWFSSVEIASLPADDFFRFGTETDYTALGDVEARIAEQEERTALIIAAENDKKNSSASIPLQHATAGYGPGVSLNSSDYTPLSILHPTVRAVVTVTEIDDEESYITKSPDAIEWNPAFDKNATVDTLLNEAIEELKAHPDAYTLDDFVLHAALLAESAKEQGMPDEHAYHGAIIALHDYILSIPEPDEVDEWRREFVPLRAARGLNRALQTLSNWIHAAHADLPKPLRSFLSALYRWIEGLAAKLKTYGIKIYLAAQYVGDQLARLSIVLWREFSKALLPLFEIMFGGKLAKRMKAVWALGGVAKNPSMSAQRRLQEMYALASYERDPHFETAYKQAIEDVISHLPSETNIGPNLYPSHIKPVKGKRPLIEAGKREDFIKWLYPSNDKLGRSQYRAATVPLKAVMSRFEADAIVEGKTWSALEIDRLNELRKSDYPAFARALTDKYNASGRAVSLDDDRVAQLYHDIYLSEQVLTRLQQGAPQTVDHVWEVAQNPSVMYEMQERYAYYGLKFDPSKEIIPPVLPPERMALYDEVAAKIVAKWPERYQNRQLTSPETLMNYLTLKKQWTRGSGPMFEPSYADRRQLTQLRKDGHAHIDGTDQHDIGKRFKMWESGLGYAVLKKAYADAKSGKVDVQQFAAFVKSQPTPVNKLARGVTFMPITQWFKGMMECFAQNQRVTWRSTYIGKNMPLGQHMREFFDKVRALPVVGEGDAKQMDSRFQAGILYGLGRIAHHAWTWGSPHVVNGAAIASHKAKRYEALQDGWIFNLHIPAKGYSAPAMLAPAGLNPRYTPSIHVTFKGENRFYSTRNPKTLEIVKGAISRTSREFEDWYPEAMKQLPEEDLEKLNSSIHRHRMLESTHPQYANVTKKIRGGATGLEDTTDLNTDGKKLGTIAALVTFGELIGKRISVASALDESKYIEAHTSDDNIFGIDPMRLYGITEEEFRKARPQFIQAFAENNLDMTFFFRDGEHDGVRGRFLEYLSHFSRPITNRDRLTIARVNDYYRNVMKDESWPGIKDPLTGEDPTAIVYINTSAMDSRQSANNAYKASKYNDRYLFAMIARDVGQANLKAFNFKSYTQNLAAYHTNAMRYLAAAAFPKTCVRNGIASLPEYESDEWNFIQAHFHPTEESVGKNATYQRYRIDGNVLTKRWPKGIHGEGVPIAFYERLEKLKKEAQFPAYTTIVYNHMKPQKEQKINKTARTWAKVTRGVLSPDEGIKQTLDEMREFFQAIPKKFTRGVVPTLEMVHPDEIWQGSGRVEASIFKKYEQDCIAAGTTTNLGGFSRLINRSPYGGCCDAAYWYHHFHTDEGNALLAAHPDYVWRNACTMISVIYGFSWMVERFILGLAWIGMFWAVMMFYLIDVSKIYSVLGLIRWHSTMDADPYIAGLLPRDVYIHSKRFSDWAAGFVPMGFFYFLRFDIIIDGPSEWCSHIAKMVQTFTYTTPMTSTQPGAPQNEWGPIASTVITELQLLRNAARTAVVSVKGPTGTGKSTWLVYEIMRLWLLERGGRTFLVAPFTVLRDDWSLPSWFGFGNHDTPEAERNSLYQVLKGGVTIASNKKILLATYGHFAGRLERGEIRENDIVCMDETHLGGPAQVLVQRLCEERGIAIVNLSATPARVEGLDQGDVIDATNVVTQKNRKKVELFPAATPQTTMLQEMLAKKEVDPLLGYSHRDMAMRCIIKVNKISGKGDNVISHIIAGIDELRKADPEIPMAFEFSSATFKTQKKEREEYCNKGRYIIVATDIIGVGYDIKPPAYSIIDNGLTIQEHQGFLQQPMNSTKDQMEQFHGRVGRNSSDRNGLIYCTENAGTGTPAQSYGSGSYYVDDRICKAIGVPRLKEVPAGAAVPSFPYFGISPTIADPQLRAGLVWTFLMALSGVAPHEMPTFYRRYAEQGWKLPEEQEWLAKQIESARVSQQVPSWRVIDTLHMQDPFFVFVENMAVLGGSTAHKGGFQLERGGQFCGPIYPRAGQWMTYSHLSRNRNTITVKAKITTESEAFEEITKGFEERIAKLEARLKKRNGRLTDGSNLKDELEIRRLQTQRVATRAGQAASTFLDSLKPQIVSAVASRAQAHAHDSIWSAGLEEARKRTDIPTSVSRMPPPFNPSTAVREAMSAAFDAEEKKQRLPVDKPAAHRMIKAAIESSDAQQSRKAKRAELNIAYSRFRLQAKSQSIPDELIQIAWNTNRDEILENTATNMHVYDITPNKKLTDCLIRWTYWRGANRRSLPCKGDEHDRDEIEQVCKEHIEGEVNPVDAVCLICRTCKHS